MDEKTIKDTLLKDLYIRVPMAGYRLKPIYLNGNVYKNSYKYNHEGGNSKARNPKIQNMLRMIGFGENVGSGFPKIIAAWKETNWGEPQLLNKLDVDEVELVLPVPSPKTAPANAPVNAPVKLNKTQLAIIKALLKDNRATYEDLAQTIGVDRTTVRRNIAVLKEKGYIRRIGEDKNGHWEVLINL